LLFFHSIKGYSLINMNKQFVRSVLVSVENRRDICRLLTSFSAMYCSPTSLSPFSSLMLCRKERLFLSHTDTVLRLMIKENRRKRTRRDTERSMIVVLVNILTREGVTRNIDGCIQRSHSMRMNNILRTSFIYQWYIKDEIIL
jgi:hypothetical protein